MLQSRFDVSKGVEVVVEEEEIDEVSGDTVAEESIPERKLKRFEVSNNLSVLGKTAEGDGYTYLKATIVGMSLTDLSCIRHFKHLQFIDVSNNYLTLYALEVLVELPYVVLIQANNNQLNSIALKRMRYLQVIIANNNKISSIYDVYQPELSTLELGHNKIQTIHCENAIPTLKVLDLRNNFIEHILDIHFDNLDSLYLAGNRIKSLLGLENLVNLRILHVRNNPIKRLDGFAETHTKLQYVNLRNCKIKTLRQIKRLKVLPTLETLILKGCLYMGGSGEDQPDGDEQGEDDPELRIEVLACMPRLKRLNKANYTPEERAQAKDLMLQWVTEGDKSEDPSEEEVEEEIEGEALSQ